MAALDSPARPAFAITLLNLIVLGAFIAWVAVACYALAYLVSQ